MKTSGSKQVLGQHYHPKVSLNSGLKNNSFSSNLQHNLIVNGSREEMEHGVPHLHDNTSNSVRENFIIANSAF